MAIIARPAWGADVSYSWHHWQLWAEAMATSFQVPQVGDADAVSYYIETRYKIRPKWFVALRWNQQLFAEVAESGTGDQPWDRDAWRLDVAVGHRPSRHIQFKLQYSRGHQRGSPQQAENPAAFQATYRF